LAKGLHLDLERELFLIKEIHCYQNHLKTDRRQEIGRPFVAHTHTVYRTLGGKVHCNQCQAQSKHTKTQCIKPAMKGKRVCRTHGGASTGPKTPQGRQRCIDVKLIHGRETRSARTERAEAMRRLRTLEDLGHALGIMRGARMPGRKT